MNNILQSTKTFEAWLRATLAGSLVEADLDKKHKKMRSNSFAFLRATYWRWAETILDLCPDLATAPAVLAIGDTHLENFGTWRDGEGRLVWGAILAREAASPSATAIAAAILSGYRRGLGNPAPVILERDYKWLRNAVLLSNDERKDFWDKFAALPACKTAPQDKYVQAISHSLPDQRLDIVLKPRTAGTGSLGRPRYVALVDHWRGGPLLREAKALAISAWSLRHDPADRAIHAGIIADGRARSPDPQYKVTGDVLVRRLSPNSRKIEVDGDLDTLLSPDMLDLMGFEIANCHCNDASVVASIRADLDKRGDGWLHAAAKTAAAAVAAEQAEYAAAT